MSYYKKKSKQLIILFVF